MLRKKKRRRRMQREEQHLLALHWKICKMICHFLGYISIDYSIMFGINHCLAVSALCFASIVQEQNKEAKMLLWPQMVHRFEVEAHFGQFDHPVYEEWRRGGPVVCWIGY